MILEIKVIPQSRENEIVEFKQGILKVKIKGTPVKGKVNEALIKFLAKWLDVSRSQIEIVAGLTSPRKKIRIEGVKEADLLELVKDVSE